MEKKQVLMPEEHFVQVLPRVNIEDVLPPNIRKLRFN